MRFPFIPNSALAAIYVFRFLAKATQTVNHTPIIPGAPLGPYITLRSDSGACSATHSNLTIKIQNDQSSPLFFYITGKQPIDNNFVVLWKQDECYTWYLKPAWADGHSAVPHYFVNASDESSDFHNMVQPNGSTSFMLPSYVNSARLYVSQDRLRFGTNVGGPDSGFVEPSATNQGLPEYNITWQFIEFTYGKDNFILNPSYVDFAAMSLDLTVTSGTAGANKSTVRGLGADALKDICADLTKQSMQDKQSWKDMCLVDRGGNHVRALSPTQYLALNPNDKMANYYDDYVNKVWEKYQNQTLTINTQDDGMNSRVAHGREVTCKVDSEGHYLQCLSQDVPDSDQAPFRFRKPTTFEIMGCVQGSPNAAPNETDPSPFTVSASTNNTQALIVPRLCAAFIRSTLLLSDGDIQPNENITFDRYYTENITNHYSRIIHSRLVNQIGYAFAYDDTNPSGDDNRTTNAGGVIQDPDPTLLLIRVR
ncbi:hypothetical protein diail_4556 [Diaporthe ilicicola]|nr:hypothetical protein diail_4556 [Diaporthe ilicicola]